MLQFKPTVLVGYWWEEKLIFQYKLKIEYSALLFIENQYMYTESILIHKK